MTAQDSRLGLVDLKQELPGFREFFSAWVYQTKGYTLVVDCGPTSSLKYLTNHLSERGIHQIDLLLLTHIHLDHAGGAGHLATQLPVKQVVCHPKAIKHLIDPERLWQGSLEALGELAKVQGQPAPLPAELLLSSEELHQNPLAQEIGLSVFPTPGHAPHHVTYEIDRRLFVGEALGVILPPSCFTDSSPEEAKDLSQTYLRPATPPRLFAEDYISSVERLNELCSKAVDDPYELCFGHFGRRASSPELLSRSFQQLSLWQTIVDRFRATFGESASFEEMTSLAKDKIIPQLVEQDPQFAPYGLLPADIKSREEAFVLNSIRGIWWRK